MNKFKTKTKLISRTKEAKKKIAYFTTNQQEMNTNK